MALETYRGKRNFELTSEPPGDVSAVAGHAYLIQKHDARRLHYDFRLELDGVLKSWAVTKGPSLVAGEKRLAVHVEDHPLDYGDFEGTIPKGQYGGGTVMLWDRGSWQPIGDPHKGYAKGHLEFELHGEKLSGRWHLVRMHGKPGEKADNWLLIKADDAVARPAGADDLLERERRSVKSGRDLDEIATGQSPVWQSGKKAGGKPSGGKPLAGGAGRRRAAVPAEPAPSAEIGFIEPALATLVAKPPAGRRWLHEIKFDGYRLQAHLDAGRLRLFTRSGLDWTARFGDGLAEACRALAVESAILDGELVVETGAGGSSFAALQMDLSEGRTDRFVFYAFDLLAENGEDLRSLPLTGRKDRLARLIGKPESGVLRFSEHFEEQGDMLLRHACRLSLEGLVSKLKDAPYRSGRSRDWVKSKCAERQEFVVGGYVPSSTSRQAIGSLVLGVYEDGQLRHVGRVGTGFTSRLARDLFSRLDARRRAASPFAGKLTAEAARDAVFVEPVEVAEVEFRGWTQDRNLRHASFRGLREDKPATQVVDEGNVAEGAVKGDAKPPAAAVKLTHADRLYWPADGVTKAGLADYYAEVWPKMAPFIVARPLALLRCPDGIDGQCFFQKHAWKGINRHIRLVPDPGDKAAEPVLVIEDFDGLIALVQAGVLEIHPWGAPLAGIEKPDLMTFDLDPGPEVRWKQVIAAAEEVRQRLERAGLACFVKTSGGKGLHVVAPLKPAADWPAVKAFAKALADRMAADDPDHFVAVATKARRSGRIFVDYLRNGRGATAVAPYSTRARAGGGVSMPLAWEELGEAIGPAFFTIDNAPARLARLDRDPWADFFAEARVLPESGA